MKLQSAWKASCAAMRGWRAAGQFPPARLGHFAAALLGLPDSRHPLSEVRRRSSAGCRLPVTLPDDATFDKPGNALDHHRPGST